jgi:2-oxoglutarate dehydrogenase E2 component (dihydrolipoamide succinyltransferase)
MAGEIVVPELGESVLEATVSRWMKKEGEFVRQGEPVVELETDKVNLEVSALQSGVLTQILRKEGEDVKVGETLATIEPAPEGEMPTGATGIAAAATSDRPPERAVPSAPAIEEAALPVKSSPVGKVAAEEKELKATPVAERMAREIGVDIRQIPGTGPGGRATKQDVLSYVEAQARPETHSQIETEVEKVIPSEAGVRSSVPSGDQREERVRMSRRRRTIAARLVQTQHSAAMLTTFNEVDMSAVMDLRRRRNDELTARFGVKLGITSFFVKASVAALKVFPRLNAEIDGDDMILKRYYHIGVAVGDEEGLVVPVVRNADRLSLVEIERQIHLLVQKVNDGTLGLDDLRGSTFTITNGGVFGSLLSTPILNGPEVGILGLHKIEERPVVISGQIVIRPMMYVALSYDHRIVDGREAVQFLVRIKELIENPDLLLVEG